MRRKFEMRIARCAESTVVAALACTSLVLVGCGYHIAGRAAKLPSSWHTIAVPAFINHTPTYRIEQRVTNAVIRELLERTTYRVVPSPARADAVLHGQITEIETTPLLFDASSGEVTAMLVTMKLKVRLVDASTKQIVYENNNFVFRNEYEISTNVKSFFQESDPAFQRMANDFAADLVSNLLEGF